jgi:ribosome-associated protein
MEDTSSDKRRKTVKDLAGLLALHNGDNVRAMDLSGMNTWTDYFVIATATSSVHMRGLLKHVKDFIAERDVDTYRRSPAADDEEWILIDCGWFVVHLMNKRAREFYDLEKLWFEAKTLQ